MAGNRTLHFDQYCMLMLLFLFNPAVRSLRATEQASELRKVQRKLGWPHGRDGVRCCADRAFSSLGIRLASLSPSPVILTNQLAWRRPIPAQ
jgi:hypothetical protein